MPGWPNCKVVLLTGPQRGARFSQMWIEMPAGATAQALPAGLQRFVLVRSGSVEVHVEGGKSVLSEGDYAFFPSSHACKLRTQAGAHIIAIEKPFSPRAGSAAAPRPVLGNLRNVPRSPVAGDPMVQVQKLLPDEPEFDHAINVMNFEPGGALSQVECHVMEHGLLMLTGQGVYRLGDHWYPVQKDDFIFMAPYCPQWFAAHGSTPASYLLYKDWNRDVWV
jgi:(S)-ureidoglycine aminohydrolase